MLGRNVVVFVSKSLPVREIDMDRVFLYLLQLLDPVVTAPYVVVYLNTDSSSDNRPDYAWLRRMYDLLDRKFVRCRSTARRSTQCSSLRAGG